MARTRKKTEASVTPETSTAPAVPAVPAVPEYEKTFDGLYVVSDTVTRNKKVHGTRTAELVDIIPEGYQAVRVELTYPGDVQGEGILSMWTSEVGWEDIRNNQNEVIRRVLSPTADTRRALSIPRPVLTYNFDATDYPQRAVGVVFHSPPGLMVVNGRPLEQRSIIRIKVICRKVEV